MTTTKKILAAVIIIIIIGMGALWYTNTPTEQGGEVTTGRFNIRNFLPFGDEKVAETSDNTTDTQNSQEPKGDTNPGFGTGSNVKLRKIWNTPTAGGVLITAGSTTVARLVEKATGNVYEVKTTGESRRLTNETIPRIARAFWLSDGSGFLAQSVDGEDTIETSFIKLSVASATSTENLTPYKAIISNLPTGIREIAVSPDNKKIFYLVDEIGSAGYTSNPDGTAATKVFTNFLTEWIPQWYSANSILIASKASSAIPSFGFILNPNTKTVAQSYGNAFGASALMRKDGQYLILGNGGSPELFLQGATSTNFSVLNRQTLPEKCIWDPNDLKFIYCAIPKFPNSSNYPDAWYQGLIETDDTIERINVFDQYGLIVSNLRTDSGISIGATNLQVSKDGKFMIFTNQNDSSLWLLSI